MQVLDDENELEKTSLRTVRELAGRAEGATQVEQYVSALLQCVGFNNALQGRWVKSHYPLTFRLLGREEQADADLVVTYGDSNKVVIVVVTKMEDGVVSQESKTQLTGQLIAGFDHNSKSLKADGAAPENGESHKQMMYGIVFQKTIPTFYKMEVSEKLVECAYDGTSPSFVTELMEYQPVPNPLPATDSARLDNLKMTLRSMEALKIAVFEKTEM